jgi:predicted enzyme related to lactoylglutathione lyase
MNPNFILLAVTNPTASSAFYATLLGRQPIEQSPSFVMFEALPGMMLGLWKRDDVKPTIGGPGGAELCFPVPSNADVDRLASEWEAAGTTVIQTPTDMDFGRTFTATDPDGHRLRIFHPAGRA